MMDTGTYQVIPLESGGYRIEDSGVRCFLFPGSEKALLVDTGFGTGDLKALVDSLTDLPVMLVNTHCDRDHIGCNTQFSTAWMHPAEYDRYQYGKDSALPATPLWEGERICLGGRSFEVVLIPGHTPGSIALLDRENRILLAGDSVQAGTIYLFGPGRNLPAYKESIRKLISIQDSFDLIYPSHGPFPVKPDLLDKLLRGALDMEAGKITPTMAEVHGGKVPLYDIGAAKFLYQ